MKKVIFLNLLGSGLIFLHPFLSITALAHNLKTDADIGATFHIEPNHNPRAGETAQAWFVLTHSGGKIIPLTDCNCQLVVYLQSSSKQNIPVLTPPLKAISVEKYKHIPGAEIIFPEAGIYELKLSGRPKIEAHFQAFQLIYTVTVTPGRAKVNPSANQQTWENTNLSVQSSPAWEIIFGIPIAVALIIIALLILRVYQQKSHK